MGRYVATQSIAARTAGWLFLAAGILGALDTPLVGTPASGAIFTTGPALIVVAIVAGLAGMAAPRLGGDRLARVYNLGAGVLLILAGLTGLVLQEVTMELLAYNVADALFDLVVGTALVTIGLRAEVRLPYPTA